MTKRTEGGAALRGCGLGIRLWRPLSLVLLLIMTSVAMPTAQGQSSEELDERDKQRQEEIDVDIEAIKADLDEAIADEAQLVAEVQLSERRKGRLDDDIARLGREIQGAQAAVAAADRAYVVARDRVDAVQIEIGRVQVARDVADEAFRHNVASSYMGGNTKDATDIVEALLKQGSFNDLQILLGYTDSVLDWRHNLLELQRALLAEAERLGEDLVAAQSEAATEQDKRAATLVSLADARDRQNAVRSSVVAEMAHQTTLVEEIKDRQVDYQTRVASLEAESDAIEAELARRESERRRSRGVGPGTQGNGQLGHPVPGARISSRYGVRTHPIYRTRRMHTGMDFAAPRGREILAAEAGEVIAAGSCGGYGNAVIIDHGGGLTTLYAHQSRIAVRVGAEVGRGDVIGYVGSTGFSTGPHLHWEVRVNGAHTDPAPFLG